ncbi:hypothetical protein [Zymomonas mobilis]|uniref:oxidoreductase n=1 Tax=Zymomonas mobilis TaxID=542 RepID=UPI0030B82054
MSGLTRLVQIIHKMGAKAGAQIGHAGRMLGFKDKTTIAPSAVPFSEGSRVLHILSEKEIINIIEDSRLAAKRVSSVGFDILELHTAHGYLLNEFSFSLANNRNDKWGGNYENRYRIVRHIFEVIRQEWTGPLFVRMSATDYAEGENSVEYFLIYGQWMKEQGVDLVDSSSGRIAPVKVTSFPGYQVLAADLLRKELAIMTGAVGLIETGYLAEDIISNEWADLVLIGRAILLDPFWPRMAADQLRVKIVHLTSIHVMEQGGLIIMPRPIPLRYR